MGQAGRLEREGTYQSYRDFTYSGERVLYALAHEDCGLLLENCQMVDSS